MINYQYYDVKFQTMAICWWRTLSINQMKAFEKKHSVIGDMASDSEIAYIWDVEINGK